jgi:CubicO group peptidase (beta-lactamase class C family)
MVLRSSNSPLTLEFDALVQQQMDKWKVPGLSIAVVHGSSTWSKVWRHDSLDEYTVQITQLHFRPMDSLSFLIAR